MSTQVFLLPDLGEGLIEAELVRWLVEVGDTVAVDTPVAEVETAKATVEVPSPFAGVIAQLHGDEGMTLNVGEPLISVAAGDATASREAEAYVKEGRAGSGNVLIGYGTSDPAATRRRRRAAASTSAPAPAPPTADAAAELVGNRTRLAVQSPIVRQLARRRGVELTTVVGTGPHGVITRRDVEGAGTDPAPTPRTAPVPTGGPGLTADLDDGQVDRRTGLRILTRVPIKGLRKSVAETLTRSRAEIPEATTWVDVDATELMQLRWQLKQRGDAPGILAMIARFVVAGLDRFPELNSRVDAVAGEITHLDGVNLGIATQTDRGLLVPSVRDAHRLGMRGLDVEIRRLTAAARDGSVTADELTTGSFTLNNYGVLGVDGSAAIINHPEVAILGMGRIIARPWVVDGEVIARQIMQLSLAFDHRVCDGAAPGGLLRFVADAIESPTSTLAEL